MVSGASQEVLVVRNPPANAEDLRDVGFIPGSGRSPGGGHCIPLQYSCLEKPMDRGAWQATVHGVAKGQIRLKWLSSCSSRWSLRGKLEEGCLSALSGVVQEPYLSCFWMRRVSWVDAVLSRPCTRVSDDWMFWTRYSLWPNLLLRWYLLLAWKKSINSSTLSCLKKKSRKCA